MDLEQGDVNMSTVLPAGAGVLVPYHGDTSAVSTVPGRDVVNLYLATLRTDAGRRAMLSALRTLAGWVGVPDPYAVSWHTLGAGVAALVARVQGHPTWARANMLRHECALAGVMKACWRVGLLDRETLSRVCDFPRSKVLRRVGHHAAGRQLSRAELGALALAAGALSPHDTCQKRDRAFVALMVGCGLRREETVTLAYTEDLSHMTIHGKGGRERDLVPPGWVVRVLSEWVAVRGTYAGPLLAPVTKHGRVRVGAVWSVAGASKRWVELCTRAGVVCTPHDTRRTWITEQLTRGTDIALVARAVGHVNVTTTAGYDRRGISALEELAAQSVSPGGFDMVPVEL